MRKTKLVTIRTTEDERKRWSEFAEKQERGVGTILRQLMEREIAVARVQEQAAK